MKGHLSKEERQKRREERRARKRERKMKKKAANSQFDLFGNTGGGGGDGDDDGDNDGNAEGALDSADEPPSSDDEGEGTRMSSMLARAEWSRSIAIEDSQHTLLAFENDSSTQKLRGFIRKGSASSASNSNSNHAAATAGKNMVTGAKGSAPLLVAPAATGTSIISPIKRSLFQNTHAHTLFFSFIFVCLAALFVGS